MNKIKLTVISLAALVGVVFMTPSYIVAAAPATPAGQIQDGVDSVSVGKAPKLSDSIKVIVNLLLYLLGAIAVIMIVIGGIRYTTSNGDSSSITSAKNTILYSVVGLVVAILAYAIVNFVITAFT
jgi:hypothetical protein